MKMTPIPYKGTPEALQEIVAGRTHLLIAPPLAVMPMYETKQVKVLAVTGNERLASMPEVPTLKESGIPFSAYAWLGVCAGAGIPQPVVDLLNSRIVQIVNSAIIARWWRNRARLRYHRARRNFAPGSRKPPT